MERPSAIQVPWQSIEVERQGYLKRIAALLLGWMVLRLTSEEVKSGSGVRMLERLLKEH